MATDYRVVDERIPGPHYDEHRESIDQRPFVVQIAIVAENGRRHWQRIPGMTYATREAAHTAIERREACLRKTRPPVSA